MSRIEINAGGRHIIVDHDGGELEPLRVAALSLFEATANVPDRPGPAVGFRDERRWSPPASPLGSGAYNRGQPPAPVTASAEAVTRG